MILLLKTLIDDLLNRVVGSLVRLGMVGRQFAVLSDTGVVLQGYVIQARFWGRKLLMLVQMDTGDLKVFQVTTKVTWNGQADRFEIRLEDALEYSRGREAFYDVVRGQTGERDRQEARQARRDSGWATQASEAAAAELRKARLSREGGSDGRSHDAAETQSSTERAVGPGEDQTIDSGRSKPTLTHSGEVSLQVHDGLPNRYLIEVREDLSIEVHELGQSHEKAKVRPGSVLWMNTWTFNATSGIAEFLGHKFKHPH